jgi:hypothetical protein
MGEPDEQQIAAVDLSRDSLARPRVRLLSNADFSTPDALE